MNKTLKQSLKVEHYLLMFKMSNTCFKAVPMVVMPLASKFFSSLMKVWRFSFHPALMFRGYSSKVNNMYLSPRLSGLFCLNLTKNSTAPLAMSRKVERPDIHDLCCIEAEVSTKKTMIVMISGAPQVSCSSGLKVWCRLIALTLFWRAWKKSLFTFLNQVFICCVKNRRTYLHSSTIAKITLFWLLTQKWQKISWNCK